MFDIFGELLVSVIVWIFVETIFDGICYFTGMLLTPLVTFGKYYPSKAIKNKELRQASRAKGNKFIYVKGKRKYLTSDAVSLIGMAFWLTVIIVAMIFFIFSAS
ncbi:hypothetical protein Riv7116_0071 [Rivularia sp. PCC 7116]|uniref:hypothetical protein n=1 Tax=Rivularia sp. PCC 7116 TaxID=373994 RepID=UPI00029EDF74|nr:hypothetical protein [Rivularia sp. PCC 7116]AFY52683.1 hypothetical protein Riv7116_0071 [Rivularia sp. PCC 7116]